jgi:hypothetical protein
LSVPLREEYRLRVSEKRMLGRIFGSKRNEVAGDWRKLHNKEDHNFDSHCSNPRMRWAERVTCMSEKGSEYKMLVGNLAGKVTGKIQM